MMIVKSDGTKEQTEIKAEVNFSGNWNYKDKTAPAVCSKPLGVIKLIGNEIVFTHKDLFDLLKVYHEADLLAVNMINAEYVNTGVVSQAESLFIDKLREWIDKQRRV